MATSKSLLSKFALCLGLLSLVTAGCGGGEGPVDTYPREVVVEVRVTGTDPLTQATVQYSNDTGGSNIVDDAPLPFSASVTRTVERYDNVALSAETLGDGELTLEILVDGESVKKQSFAGDSSIVGTTVYLFP